MLYYELAPIIKCIVVILHLLNILHVTLGLVVWVFSFIYNSVEKQLDSNPFSETCHINYQLQNKSLGKLQLFTSCKLY